MLGRSLGLTEDQMRHLNDDPLPATVYDSAQAAIIRYAQKSTRLEPIDNETYGALSGHFSIQQIMDICLTVGLSNMVNRFHATFQTDVDAATLAAVEAGDAVAGVAPSQGPSPQGNRCLWRPAGQLNQSTLVPSPTSGSRSSDITRSRNCPSARSG